MFTASDQTHRISIEMKKLQNTSHILSLGRKRKANLPVLPLAGKNRNGVEKLITTVVGNAAVLTLLRITGTVVVGP